VSTLSLSFLQKAVIGTSAAVSRGSAMKTDYLARSAANHALWRLLNDPDFSPTGTDYDMHDFGDGRYGYKVRKPSLTQFGTVATVGAVGDTVAKQSYVQYLKPYNIITAYGRSADPVPEYRQLLGASWADASDTVNIGSNTVAMMTLKGCPTRKEAIMGTMDANFHLNFAVWDGSSWGNLTEFTQTAGWNDSLLIFGIAYESQSGDALVVGRDGWAAEVKYTTWNGSAWNPAVPAVASTVQYSSVEHVAMASNPLSDEIFIAAATEGQELNLIQWDGAAFNFLGLVDDRMETSVYGCAAVVYEQQSGHAMILWNHRNSKKIYYRTWNGSVLSATGYLPQFGQKPMVIRAAADPASDSIFAAAVDNNQDLSVAVWDGSSWTDSEEIAASVAAKEGQVIDVAWESSGGTALTVWPEAGSSTVKYFSWQTGTALSDHSAQTGPDFDASVSKVLLSPVSGSHKIILLGSNSSDDLRYSLWTGSSFLGDPGILLESNLSSGNLPFGIAEAVAP
jgi:hypothetical protein